jgi:hypothetical protein
MGVRCLIGEAASVTRSLEHPAAAAYDSVPKDGVLQATDAGHGWGHPVWGVRIVVWEFQHGAADASQYVCPDLMDGPSLHQPTSCSLVYNNTQVVVSAATHDVTVACEALQKGWAGNGQYWANGSLRTLDQSGTPVQFTVVCALGSTTNDQKIAVEVPSDASQDLANSACASFASTGSWRQGAAGTTTTLATSPMVTDRGGNRCQQDQMNHLGYCLPSSITGSTYTDPTGRKCAPANTNGAYCNRNVGTTGGPPPAMNCPTHPIGGDKSYGCYWVNAPNGSDRPPFRPQPGSRDSQLGCTFLCV